MRDEPPSTEAPADLAADRARLLELRPLIERIIRYAHFRGANQESVEDKVQKVLVRALDGLRRGEERPHGFTAWVISIARNVASSERRTKRRTDAVFAQISTMEVDFASGQTGRPFDRPSRPDGPHRPNASISYFLRGGRVGVGFVSEVLHESKSYGLPSSQRIV